VGLLLLVLLLLAAAAGVLGAVLEVTLVLILSLVLTVVTLAWLGTWYARRRLRAFQRDLQARFDRERRRREAYDVSPHEGGRELPPER
jgi:membrane protein implicated in regulation of membrane protease activity